MIKIPEDKLSQDILGFRSIYCKSRNIGLQEKLANLALGQNLNMVV